MARFDSEPVVAPIGTCECPGSPHDQDEVYLKPRLDYDGGVAASEVFSQAIVIAASNGGDLDTNALARLLVPVYIEHGAYDWNLLDADGVPVPFDAALILADYDTARAVGEVADDTYASRVLAPLVRAVANSSQPTPTTGSTSAKKRSRKPNPKPSSPSSMSDTRTVGTVTILRPHDGDSSTSPSQASAG